jgi:hypothetical protein
MSVLLAVHSAVRRCCHALCSTVRPTSAVALWVTVALLASARLEGQQNAPPVQHLGSRVVDGSGRIDGLLLNMEGSGEAADLVEPVPGTIRVEYVNRSAWEHHVNLMLPPNLDALGRVTIPVKKADRSATKRVFTLDLKAPAPVVGGVSIAHGQGPAGTAFDLPATGNRTYNLTFTGGPFHQTDTVYFADPGLAVVPGSFSLTAPGQLNLQVRVTADKLPSPGPVVTYVSGPFRTGATTHDLSVSSAFGPVVHAPEPIRLAANTTVSTTLSGSNLYPQRVFLRRAGNEIAAWETLTSSPTSITVRGRTPSADEILDLVVVNRDGRETATPVAIGQNVGDLAVSPVDGVRIYADAPTVVRFARRNRPVLPTPDGTQYKLTIGGQEIQTALTVIGDTIIVATLNLPSKSFPSLSNPATLPVVITGPNKLSWNGTLELAYPPRVTGSAYSPLFPGGKATLNVSGEYLQGVTLRPVGPVKLTLAPATSPTHLQAEMEVTDEVDPGPVEIEAVKDGAVIGRFNVEVATRPEFSFVRVSIPDQEVSGRFTSVAIPRVNRGDLIKLTFHGDSLPPNVGKQTIKAILRSDSASLILEERTVTVRRGQTPEIVLRVPDTLQPGSSARLSLEHSTGERQNTVALPVRQTWDERVRLAAGASALRWVPSRTADNAAVGDAFIGLWWDFSPNARPMGLGFHMVALDQNEGGPAFGFGPGVHFSNLSISFARGPSLATEPEATPGDGAAAAATGTTKKEGHRWYIIFGGSLSTTISSVFGG